MSVRLYVEGGGDHNKALQTQCRRGFSEFIRKCGLERRMPRIVACGGRRQAYDSFRTSHDEYGVTRPSMLLVDSEGPVSQSDPWEHVRRRPGDEWERPQGTSDEQLQLMVQAMEAWFFADKKELNEFYGRDFRSAVLSQRSDIENIPKRDLLAGLQAATKDCRKGEYSKGDHSFQILARIDPVKVRAASPLWAERFLRALDQMCARYG